MYLVRVKRADVMGYHAGVMGYHAQSPAPRDAPPLGYTTGQVTYRCPAGFGFMYLDPWLSRYLVRVRVRVRARVRVRVWVRGRGRVRVRVRVRVS
jgi:hypothetical protein